jgi:hypothetical protein
LSGNMKMETIQNRKRVKNSEISAEKLASKVL